MSRAGSGFDYKFVGGGDREEHKRKSLIYLGIKAELWEQGKHKTKA